MRNQLKISFVPLCLSVVFITACSDPGQEPVTLYTECVLNGSPPAIKTVMVKDCKWVKGSDGQWYDKSPTPVEQIFGQLIGAAEKNPMLAEFNDDMGPKIMSAVDTVCAWKLVDAKGFAAVEAYMKSHHN